MITLFIQLLIALAVLGGVLALLWLLIKSYRDEIDELVANLRVEQVRSLSYLRQLEALQRRIRDKEMRATIRRVNIKEDET